MLGWYLNLKGQICSLRLSRVDDMSVTSRNVFYCDPGAFMGACFLEYSTS